jgi:DNA 3'-phosphatase
MMWKKINSCFTNIQSTNYNKAVAFDFDDTLVKFKTDTIMENVENKLKQLNETYHIIIFSNQFGVNTNHTTNDKVQKRFDDFIDQLNIPITIFYSTKKDEYRKPEIEMYNLCLKLFNKQNDFIEYYCGDACGRVNDFSASDLYFANNCDLKFTTPEILFLNKSDTKWACKKIKSLELYKQDVWEEGKLKTFENFKVKKLNDKIDLLKDKTNKKILLLMIGPPGSGKSTLSRYYALKYNLKIISSDIYKKESYKKYIFDKYINDEYCNGIVIDDLNTKKINREKWINLVKDLEFDVYKIHINIPKNLSIHLCKYRYMYDKKKYIPNVAIHKYYKYVEIPEDCIVLNNAVSLNDFKYKLRFVW